MSIEKPVLPLRRASVCTLPSPSDPAFALPAVISPDLRRRGSVFSALKPRTNSPTPASRPVPLAHKHPLANAARVGPDGALTVEKEWGTITHLVTPARRGSTSSASSGDQCLQPGNFIRPQKSIKHFYQSNPQSPMPQLHSPQDTPQGFGDYAAPYQKKSIVPVAAGMKVFRRMSTGDLGDTADQTKTSSKGILGVIREQIEIGSINNTKLANKLFSVMLNPLPAKNAEIEEKNEVEDSPDKALATVFNRAKYSQLPANEVETRLKQHVDWIRKGEQGFFGKRGKKVGRL